MKNHLKKLAVNNKKLDVIVGDTLDEKNKIIDLDER